MLWENSGPKTLNDYHTHTDIVNNLKKLSTNIKNNGNFPNMIIHGQYQSGKYTLAKCFLESIFGPTIYNTTNVYHNVRQACSSYTIKIAKSLYHYETTLSGLQYADRLMLISLLNTFFSTTDINRNSHKILVLKHFDELSKPAQFALRRRIETDYNTVRYILLVKSLNNIEKSIKSRFLCIKCSKATTSEINSYLNHLVTSNNLSINQSIIERATLLSDNIIGNSIIYLSYLIESNSLDVECPIDIAINDLIKCIYSPTYPYDQIRDIISKLQLSKILPQKIFHAFINEATKIFNNNSYIYKIVSLAADADLAIATTNKYSISLETFIISVFNIIKHYNITIKDT